ncbi:hypothetical protein LX32DRAFT_309205 [Colletotrichum zoysiae]|uniref:Uncharacterized protein n=1 Tax=Colletotrichum zoysiae TaxID=1216348 RepID=A0AAD9HVY4_9PEZI|nr:hypothetical protein LX32DRAFT_309205 [Colletotrichum zoysiae]
MGIENGVLASGRAVPVCSSPFRLPLSVSLGLWASAMDLATSDKLEEKRKARTGHAEKRRPEQRCGFVMEKRDPPDRQGNNRLI